MPPTPGLGLPDGVSPLTADDPRHLGPFRVVGRIGSGGMGVVYAALDGADRRAAVKCVHRTYAADTEFRDRFAREVGLVRRVRGARVPRFLGADTRAEVPWLATEFVPGRTLADHVREQGPLTGRALAAFALGVAEALAAVHEAGVVHRDLKPGNVILSPTGPKVLDFGIARAADETGLTRTGGLVGTPGWISPEQYRGAPATDRSDMFAWGGLVAYAATGRDAFGAGGSEVLASRVLSEPPDLRGIPAGLREALERALDKDPERRPDAHGAVSAVAIGGGVGAFGAPDGAWTGAAAHDDQIERWRRNAPARRSWVLRHRAPLALGAVGTVLASFVALVAVLGLAAPPPGGGAEESGSDPALGADTAGGPGGAEDGLPEEYRELYETGHVAVEPVPGTAAELVRSLEPESGGDALDQLRLTFETGERFTNSVTVAVAAEYLPDFGELTIRGDDFAWAREFVPGEEYLDFDRPRSRGVLAELSPEEPRAEFTVVFLSGSSSGVAYYLPNDVLDEDRQVPAAYPGGFCHVAGYEAGEQAAPGFPDSPGLTPYDPAAASAELVDRCVYTGEPS